MTTENIIDYVNSILEPLGKEVVTANFVLNKNLIDVSTGVGVLRAGKIYANGFGTEADQNVVLAFTNPDDTTQSEKVLKTIVQPDEVKPEITVLFNDIQQIENVNVFFTGIEIVTT